MPISLIVRSFLPYAIRDFSRHPKKLGRLVQFYQDYLGRFQKIASLTDAEIKEVIALCQYLELQEPYFKKFKGLRTVHMHCLVYYVIVRLIKPEKVVETGVNEGTSSLFLLLAMEQNRHGKLYSIDLPNQDVELTPGGQRQTDGLPPEKKTGFLVPDRLRDRWDLHLGDAQTLLPALVKELGTLDIFIHDSLHSYDHMMFEYRTAWPHIRKGGLLLSDDIDYNQAFPDFSAEIQCPTVKFNQKVGAIRKP